MKKIEKEIRKICKNFSRNFPLKNITSFRTGGNARYIVLPSTYNEIVNLFSLCKKYKLPFFIIGKGTNILVSDDGLDGIVISTLRMRKINMEKEEIICEAGVRISELLKKCVENSLTGLEFLSGIPGTVGGAIVSNAGLKKEWIMEKVKKVEVILPEKGENETIEKGKINYGYRRSGLENYFIYRVFFELEKKERKEIKEKIKNYIMERKKKQPLGEFCAGSIFKNPPGLFAGELIEKCGLKGYSIGDAVISEKHANFIINKGNATSSDIYKLIKFIQEKVKEKYGIYLEPEIKLLGPF